MSHFFKIPTVKSSVSDICEIHFKGEDITRCKIFFVFIIKVAI